jgi:diguanylate cyclase (GGDEF)-like protein
MYDVLEQKLNEWLRQGDGIPVYRRVRVLEYLHSVVVDSLPNVESKYHFSEMMRLLYKDIYLLTDKTIHADHSIAERVNFVLTLLTRDMLNYANGDERTYESMLDKIDELYLRECYLYVYPEIQRHREQEPDRLPSHLCLHLYKNESEKGCPIGETQEIGPDQLFDNVFVSHSTRHTLIANMLVAAEEQYGVFVAAVDSRYRKYMRTIARQLSSTIKTIFLLQQNAALAAKLENNLRQIRANNHVLSEISRRDELTGIYNRRGFMSAVEEELNDPMNRDKKAVIVYADMNNLKIVNDRFGHEEGDFSLRLVASMLQEAFGASDIVGRFGGDEFAAFALVNQENYVAKLRERINAITDRANAKTDKPYYVSMSVGACEFLCEDGVSISDIMDTADGDLYSQKKSKRTEIMK